MSERRFLPKKLLILRKGQYRTTLAYSGLLNWRIKIKFLYGKLFFKFFFYFFLVFFFFKLSIPWTGRHQETSSSRHHISTIYYILILISCSYYKQPLGEYISNITPYSAVSLFHMSTFSSKHLTVLISAFVSVPVHTFCIPVSIDAKAAISKQFFDRAPPWFQLKTTRCFGCWVQMAGNFLNFIRRINFVWKKKIPKIISYSYSWLRL